MLVKEKQADVIGIDRTLGHASAWTPLSGLRHGPQRMVFQQLDLTDRGAVSGLFQEYPIRQVVHLAAETHVDRSIVNPDPFWRSNVLGTNNLLQAAHDFGVDRVINQITDEAYGEVPEGEAFEGDQFHPTSPYPCSKVAQYWVGRSFHTTYGLPVISTFPVNNYGPRQHMEKLIPKFIGLLLRGEKVPLMKSTHFQRDWLPVADMCSALCLLLEKGVPGEDYNVGADRHKTNEAITSTLLQAMGYGYDMVSIVPDRKAHDCRYAVNSDKLKALGWERRHNFTEYLELTIDWYKENKEMYR
jgi:dTDP-glucose 4,6-dehydratase